MNRRRAALLAVAVVGFVAGATTILLIDRPGRDHPSSPHDASVPASVATPPPTTIVSSPSTPAADEPQVFLAWTPGGLAPGFGEAVRALPLVEAVTVVSGAELGLTRVRDGTQVVDEAESGWVIPFDVLAVDPPTHARFVAPSEEAVVDSLRPGQGLLSESAAERRGGAEGLVLDFSAGPSVEIVGVIDDLSASGSELLVDLTTGAELGIALERFVLIESDAEGGRLQADLDSALADLGASEPIRFRRPGEVPWMRHGDAVLPLAEVKRRFGEFAFRDARGRAIEIDPDWVETYIVEASVPVLGSLRCHEAMVPAIEAAMTELVDRGLTSLVNPDDFAGCFVPRRIAAGQALSRHSWGIALDINIGSNPRGSFATQDDRLVDLLMAHGLGWGGLWLVPDPGHYEALELR